MNRPTPSLIDHDTVALLLNRLINRDDDLITIAEAAKLRGCSVQNFSQLVARGRIRSFTALGKRVVQRADVIRFNSEHPMNPRKVTRSGARPTKLQVPNFTRMR